MRRYEDIMDPQGHQTIPNESSNYPGWASTNHNKKIFT